MDDISSALGLRMWMDALHVAACASSNRSKTRTLRFLKRIEKADSVDPLLIISRRWDPFDTELASAVFTIAKGGAKREMIALRQERALRSQPVCGLASL